MKQIKNYIEDKVLQSWLWLRSEEKGQGLVEYALILVLIALVVIVALKMVGTTTNKVFSNINTKLTSP